MILKWKIKRAAKKHGIDWRLVAAIVAVESNGDYMAIRYEPGFFDRYVAGNDRAELNGHVPKSIPTLSTERKLRAFSFGLMQIMGQTAREQGFARDNLTELLKPSINLNQGCSYLKHLHDKRTSDLLSPRARWYEAVAKYNGGPANPQYSYADKVFFKLKKEIRHG